MPRGARLDAPGTLHHVMLRGIERGNIVYDDEDREEQREKYGTFFSPLCQDILINYDIIWLLERPRKWRASPPYAENVGEFLSYRRTHSLIVTFIRHPAAIRAGVHHSLSRLSSPERR